MHIIGQAVRYRILHDFTLLLRCKQLYNLAYYLAYYLTLTLVAFSTFSTSRVT
jgi:hypothetical protein